MSTLKTQSKARPQNNTTELTRSMLAIAKRNGLSMRGVYLRYADLSDLDVSGMDFTNADLFGADCRGSNFAHANLSGADLSEVDGRGAKFEGAIVSSLTSLREMIINDGDFKGISIATNGSVVTLNERKEK